MTKMQRDSFLKQEDTVFPFLAESSLKYRLSLLLKKKITQIAHSFSLIVNN